MQEGWKCPVCGAGVAPAEKTCIHANYVGKPEWIIDFGQYRQQQYSPWYYKVFSGGTSAKST